MWRNCFKKICGESVTRRYVGKMFRKYVEKKLQENIRGECSENMWRKCYQKICGKSVQITAVLVISI